jgi:hypothetical protein
VSFTDQLDNLGKIKDGWDGRGSAAPTREALATAKNIGVCPLGHGGVQLELHAGGADVEIEIDANGKVIAVMWSRS